MDILIYIIPLLLLVLVFGLGFYFGCEKCFNKAHIIGTLKVAHDQDDEKYLAMVIDPLHKDILDGKGKSVQMVYVEHVFSEEPK